MQQGTLYHLIPDNSKPHIQAPSERSNRGVDSSRMQIEVLSESPIKRSIHLQEPSTGHGVPSSQKRERAENQTREGQYLNSYKQSRTILDKAPDLLNTLKSCRIDVRTRAKMVDWMFEVLYALQETFSVNTYLRSILIMDVYIKYTEERLNNEDIHLIGIGAIYIASKYEDIYHIKISTLCEKAAHGKFRPADIRRKEDDILNVLGFSVSFSSFADVADYYIIRLVYAVSPKIMEDLRVLLLNIVCLCQHDVKFNNYSPHVFVVGCFINTIRYRQSLTLRRRENILTNESIERSSQQELDIIKSIFALVEKKDRQELDDVVPVIRDYLINFDKKFGECTQIWKHGNFQKSLFN
jgi:hypothetical protein